MVNVMLSSLVSITKDISNTTHHSYLPLIKLIKNNGYNIRIVCSYGVDLLYNKQTNYEKINK
jgi:hypothetical protein